MPDILVGRDHHMQVILDPRYGNRCDVMASAKRDLARLTIPARIRMGGQILRGVRGGIFGGKH